MDTQAILADCYTQGHIGCPEAFELLVMMAAAGRGVRVPPSHWYICPPKKLTRGPAWLTYSNGRREVRSVVSTKAEGFINARKKQHSARVPPAMIKIQYGCIAAAMSARKRGDF